MAVYGSSTCSCFLWNLFIFLVGTITHSMEFANDCFHMHRKMITAVRLNGRWVDTSTRRCAVRRRVAALIVYGHRRMNFFFRDAIVQKHMPQKLCVHCRSYTMGAEVWSQRSKGMSQRLRCKMAAPFRYRYIAVTMTWSLAWHQSRFVCDRIADAPRHFMRWYLFSTLWIARAIICISRKNILKDMKRA